MRLSVPQVLCLDMGIEYIVFAGGHCSRDQCLACSITKDGMLVKCTLWCQAAWVEFQLYYSQLCDLEQTTLPLCASVSLAVKWGIIKAANSYSCSKECLSKQTISDK